MSENRRSPKNNLELIAELISKETVPDPYLYNKANSCKIYYVIKIKDVPILDVGLGGTENVWLDNEGIYHHNTTPYLNVNGVSVKYDKLFFELIDKLLPEDYISSAGLDY